MVSKECLGQRSLALYPFLEDGSSLFGVYCLLAEIIPYLVVNDMGLEVRKPVFGGCTNITGADQPAHRGLFYSLF